MRLKNTQDKYISNFIQLDGNRLIAAPSNSNCSLFQQSDGIKEYDIHNDEWSTFIQYPSNHESNTSSICANDTKSELCIFGNEKIITKVNLITKQFEKFRVDKFCGRYPSLLFLNNQYHIICGSWNKHHYIWNETTLKFESVHRFTGLYQGNHSHGLVHIKAKKQLILFGGLDKRIYQDAIWKCQYTLATNTEPATYQWEKLQLKLPFRMHSFGYILSADERYIVIVGGKVGSLHFLNDIYIADVKEGIIRKCAINCPGKSEYLCFKGYDRTEQQIELIVGGFLRTYYSDNMRNVPVEIIQMLKSWVLCYDIHLIQKGVPSQWKIAFDKILH